MEIKDEIHLRPKTTVVNDGCVYAESCRECPNDECLIMARQRKERELEAELMSLIKQDNQDIQVMSKTWSQGQLALLFETTPRTIRRVLETNGKTGTGRYFRGIELAWIFKKERRR